MFKKWFLSSVLIMIGFSFFQGLAQQVPEGINFQGVARDNTGSELANYNIDIKTTLIRNNPAGESVYTEIHQVTTDLYGLFTLVIGRGTRISGTDFSSLNWGAGDMFLKVEMDFGEGFQHVNTSQLLSVPYALYAKSAGSSEENHFFSFNESTNILSFDDQPAADLSSLKHDTAGFSEDTLNELQQIYLENDYLFLSKNEFDARISLNKYLDNTDEQQLSLSGNELSLTNGGTVTLAMDSDTDTLNEIQQLSLSGRFIILEKGGNIELPVDQYEDADADTTNELQTLSLDGDVLSLEGASAPSTVNLGKYADNTDDQKIAIAGNEISLENGGSITLPPDKTEDADADATNELQDLTFSSGILSLNKSAVEVDLNTEFIAFSAHISNIINFPGGSKKIINNYDQETFDSNDVFDQGVGEFKVPPNGDGYYRITFSASTNSSMLSNALYFKIMVGTVPVYEAHASLINTTFILDLDSGSNMYLMVENKESGETKLISVGLSAERIYHRY